jgi:hypothetical protein
MEQRGFTMQETLGKSADKADKHQVEILVNERPVKIEKGEWTGIDIKNAAVQQGVPIQSDFVLTLEKPNGQSQIIGDQDTVKIHSGHAFTFTAIADDDNS